MTRDTGSALESVAYQTTALGAAYLAGLGAGSYSDLDEIAGRRFEPDMPALRRLELLDAWHRAVEATRSFT